MLQGYDTIFPAALTILSAVITGGFVLIYVELSNKKTRETDNYEQLMRPFMHKLSSYFRFVSWCKVKIRVKIDEQKGGEKEFMQILKKLAHYGRSAIISGGDYRVNSFTADQLYDISTNKINHLWYLTQHTHSCNLIWDSEFDSSEEYIKKELEEINHKYKNLPLSLDSFIKVSSEFHTNIYQMVEADTMIHRDRMWLLNHHTRFVSFSFTCVLLLLGAMLLFHLPALLIQVATIVILILLMICLLLVGLDYTTQIKCYNKLHEFLNRNNIRMKLNFTYRLFEPLGFLLLLSAFCWQNISNEYKNQQQRIYQSKIDDVLIHAADLVASGAFRDTINYRGELHINFNPEFVVKATSAANKNKESISALYEIYQKYHWYQAILYILGSVLVVVGKSIQASRKE